MPMNRQMILKIVTAIRDRLTVVECLILCLVFGLLVLLAGFIWVCCRARRA